MSLREQLHTAILQCSKQEQLLLIEIQKLQEKAVLLDGLLEMLDEGNTIDVSTIPKIPFGYTQITKYTHIESKQLYEMFIEAIQRGDEKEVDELLQEGNRLNPSVEFNKALRMASEYGHLAIDSATAWRNNRLLQDPRVDPSTCSNLPFRTASTNGNLDMVERLLQDPRVDPSAYNNDAIRVASEKGHLAVVNRLLQDPRVDPSGSDNNAIQLASANGRLCVVDRLLQEPRVDPSADNNWAIRWASEIGHLAVVERLLQDPRVDPSADDNWTIRWASQNGHLAVVNRLLQDPRVDPSACDNLAIRWANQNGHQAVVERLQQHINEKQSK